MKLEVYYAIFTPEEGGYSVSFPDVPGAITDGIDIDDAVIMAEDALSLILTGSIKNYYKPSSYEGIKALAEEDDIVVPIFYRGSTVHTCIYWGIACKEEEGYSINFPNIYNEKVTGDSLELIATVATRALDYKQFKPAASSYEEILEMKKEENQFLFPLIYKYEEMDAR